MRKLLLFATALLLCTGTALADTSYNINVGGVEVKSSNASNITGGDIKARDTSKSYSVTYNASNNTLTLTNVSIKRANSGDFAVHNRGCNGLNIVLNDDCYLFSSKSEALKCERTTYVSVYGETYIESSSNYAVYLKGANVRFYGSGELTIATYTASHYAIEGSAGTEQLTIYGRTTTIRGYSGGGGSIGKIGTLEVLPHSSTSAHVTTLTLDPRVSNVKTLTLGTGMYINDPVGCKFTSNGFQTYDGKSLYYTSLVTISDERDDASATAIGNFLYKKSGNAASLVGAKLEYIRTLPTAALNIPGYVTIGGTLLPVQISSEAFKGKFPKVTTCYVGYGVTSIGSSAFEGNASLKTITIPSSVKLINQYFIYGTAVTEINWSTLDPTQVTTYSSSFSNGSVSATVNFPTRAASDKASTSIFPSSYTKAVNATKSHDFQMPGYQHYYVVTTAGTASSRGEMALAGVLAGTSPTINYTATYTYDTSGGGNGATYECTSVAPYAFYNNTSITTANLQYTGIKTIGERAFYGCTSLSTVTIGSGVTSIGTNGFYGCSAVRTVNWYPANFTCTLYNNAHTGGYLANLFNNAITTVNFGSILQVPDYMCANLTKLTSITIPNTATAVGMRAFYNCTGLTSVSIGTGVKTIGTAAFKGIAAQSVYLPTALTTLGNEAFDGCDKLTSITVPNGVKAIGSNTFRGCTSLFKAGIGQSVQSIDKTAFAGCTTLASIYWSSINGLYTDWTAPEQSPFYALRSNISEVVFGNDVLLVPAYLCYEFNISMAKIPASVRQIRTAAFYGTSIAGIDVASGSKLGDIADGAFYECAKLKSFVAPASLTGLGTGTFSQCTSLATVDLSKSSVTTIPDYAFNTCISMTQLKLPETLTTIGSNTFAQCTGLKKVTLPEGVTTIGQRAFSGCNGITTFSLPSTVTSIAGYAFAGNSSLVNFYAAPRCAAIAMGTDVFQNASTATATLHVKPSQVPVYKSTDQWRMFYNIVGDMEEDFDVNGDGSVNVGDVNYVLNLILNEAYEAGADVNGDGSVNVGDVNVILAYIIDHPE